MQNVLLTSLMLGLCMMVLTGCSQTRWEAYDLLRNGSLEEIDTEARHCAHADIKAGKPQVCYAGGYAYYAMGVPPEAAHLVEDLPVIRLPGGCAHPLAREAMVFAEAYNIEVVQYLSEAQAAKAHE